MTNRWYCTALGPGQDGRHDRTRCEYPEASTISGPRALFARRSCSQGVFTYFAIAVSIAIAGCGDVHVRRAHVRNGARELLERLEAGRRWEVGSAGVLHRHGLDRLATNDPASAATLLESRISDSASPAELLALAGLHYRAGLASSVQARSDESPGRFRDAAVLASLALAEHTIPSREEAITLHNRSISRLIALSKRAASREGRRWQEVMASTGIQLATTPAAAYMKPDQLESLTPTEDLKVIRMPRVHQTWGLGVPVIGIRDANVAGPEAQERYFPRDFHIGATLMLSPGGGIDGGAWRHRPARLVFHDPIEDQDQGFAGSKLPIATDKTTPLISQVDSGTLASLELIGLLRSNFEREGSDSEGGLFMRQPYRRGKIPVVLVHGLISSPRAWVHTLNELSNDPYLSRHFQFWVFLYPTGLPIPTNAALLRKALHNARRDLDPDGSDPAFDQMLLIGHSMGGILVRMMIQESGRSLWDATVRLPYEQLKAPPEIRQELANRLIFKPVPFVKRVVCIAAPHRGSPVADEFIGRTVSNLIRGTEQQESVRETLEGLNGRDVFLPEIESRRSINAVNNLSQQSPILTTLSAIPTVRGVPYHTIAYFLGGGIPYDLLVPYRSAHLEGAASETILPGTHFSQQSLETSQELRRILFEHLGEPISPVPDVQPLPASPAPRVPAWLPAPPGPG